MTDPNDKNFDVTRLAGGATPAAGAAAEQAPTRLGPYRVLKRLGGGGMGLIFLAVQESLGRHVALKVLPHAALSHPDAIERFRREVQILGQLAHPNICQVLEAGEAAGTHFYAMEYLRGLDLSRVLRAQRVDTRRAARIAVQVARALQCAHEKGVVHRDVKPQNIMVERGERALGQKPSGQMPTPTTPLVSGILSRFFGRSTPAAAPMAAAEDAQDVSADPRMPGPDWEDHVALIDFGLARDEGSAAQLTASGAVVGTPSYMAPEQARGDRRAVGPATDVYALGAVLYEMLTMRPPFVGETVGEVMQKAKTEDPIRPRLLNGLVDRDLETIVLTALEKEPARRFPSAGAMAEDLERWLAGEPVRARPASWVYRLKKRVSRNPLAAAAVAVAACAAAAGVWLAIAPGTIEIPKTLGDVVVTVRGEPAHTGLVRVWPPGTARVFIEKEGFHDWALDVEVGARSRVSIDPRLVSRTGFLSVYSIPQGAEVLRDGKVIGATPLVRARVPTGSADILIRKDGFEDELVQRVVGPSEPVTLQKTLRRLTGKLTLTSDPPVVGIELWLEGAELPILSGTPMTEYELPAGKYRLRAHIRNCASKEMTFEIRSGGTVKRYIALSGMVQWIHGADPGFWHWTADDVNGDGSPDILVSTTNPPRIRAVDGRDGRLLWVHDTMLPSGDRPLQVELADLDGDLRPEAIYGMGRDSLLVRDAFTGRLIREIPLPAGEVVESYGDHDGDALPDLVARVANGIACVKGTDGRVLWRFTEIGAAHRAPARLNGDGAPDIAARNFNEVVALDGATGAVLWRHPAPGLALPTAADLDGDGLDDLVVDVGDRWTALSGKDGTVLWEATPQKGWRGAQGAAGDVDGDCLTDLVLSFDEVIQVLDGRTGAVKCEFVTRQGFSRVVLADIEGDAALELLIGTIGGLGAHDGRTGRLLWVFEGSGGVACAPLLADFNLDGRQDVAWIDGSSAIHALSAESSPILWRQGSPHMHVEHAEALGDPPESVYIPGNVHRIVDAADGTVRREWRAPEYVFARSTRIGGTQRIFVDGDVSGLLDPETGETAWRAKWDKRPWGLPTIADVSGDGFPDVVSGDVWSDTGVRALDGRDGHELWKNPLTRPRFARSALHADLLWVPGMEWMHVLDPKTGVTIAEIPTGGPCSTVVPVDDDVLFVADIDRLIRARGKLTSRNGLDIVWERRLGSFINRHSPDVLGRLAVAVANAGTVYALDVRTGEELWRRPLPGPSGGGAGLCDLDGDGLAEIAIAGVGGDISVLRGRDGEMLFSWRLPYQLGWQTIPWADLDRDGVPEMLVTCRDGWVYAVRFQPPRRPPVLWTKSWIRSADTAERASVHARGQARLLADRRVGDWARVVAAARGLGTPLAAYEGAFAAGKLGDKAALVELADLAVRLGCRRLDLELARADVLADRSEAVRALAAALQSAPPHQLREAKPDAPLSALWHDAALVAAPELERAGMWERAQLVLAPTAPWEEVLAVSARAFAAGADEGRVAVAIGRAAVSADRFEDARTSFKKAMYWGSSLEDAREELAVLEREGERIYRRAMSEFKNGRIENGRPLADRALLMVPDHHGWLNDLAFTISIAPGATREDAEKAIGWSKRALEIHDAKMPDDLFGHCMYADTLAAAYFLAGDAVQAVKLQREAMRVPLREDYRGEMKARLEKYEKAAGSR